VPRFDACNYHKFQHARITNELIFLNNRDTIYRGHSIFHEI